MSNLSKQAQNSIELYRGQDSFDIKQLLHFQKKSVVDELLNHFECDNIGDLSVKLSML